MQGVNIAYYGHEFDQSDSNRYNYDVGVRVEADSLYTGNDFEDVTRTELFIEGLYLLLLFQRELMLLLVSNSFLFFVLTDELSCWWGV